MLRMMTDRAEKNLALHEKTLSLLKKAQAGDETAREALVYEHTALVKSVVKRFLHRGYEYDDLFQLGCMGLVKAINGYQTAYNVRFSTYAVPLIMGEIRRFLRDDGAVKVARPVKQLYAKAIKYRREIAAQTGREPGIAEIAGALGCTPEEIALSMEAARQPASLQAPLNDENGRPLSLEHCLGASAKEDEMAIDRVLLRELIFHLAPRERQVILLRYFMDKTQTEVARVLGISQVQVSRLESKILKSMRQTAENG